MNTAEKKWWRAADVPLAFLSAFHTDFRSISLLVFQGSMGHMGPKLLGTKSQYDLPPFTFTPVYVSLKKRAFGKRISVVLSHARAGRKS